MPEVTTVTQITQLGVETTEGTAVAANKLLPSLQIDLDPKTEIDRFRPNGFKVPTIHAQGKEWSMGAVKGLPTYDELSYIFASLLATPTIAQQSATTAYKHTFAPSATSPDTVKSLTVEAGSSVRARKAAGARVVALTIKGSRSGIDVSGSIIAGLITDGITLTASPTSIAQIPILAKEVDVFLDSTGAGLGTTKLLRVFEWEWSIAERFAAIWPVNSALTSYGVLAEKEVVGQLKLKIEADSDIAAQTAAMRAGSTQFVRIKATGGQNAGTAIPYSLILDQAIQVSGEPSSMEDADGVVAARTFTYDMVYDATWTKYLNVELINKLTAL